MKDPAFLSSPVHPPVLRTEPSLSTTSDDHLISLLSHDHFTARVQLTSF